jgi:hypothetical protein
VESRRKKQMNIRLVAGNEGPTESIEVYGSGIIGQQVVREGWDWPLLF